MKISTAQKHLLKLVQNGIKSDGWTPVSSVVMPAVQGLPSRLVTVEPVEGGGGRAKLTAEGETVLAWS